MADGIDAKGIGLAVKDIVIGVAAAAVGAAGGGQAGASGVLKAGDGIDKIINLATSGESRGQKFDRAGFEAKPQSPLVQGKRPIPRILRPFCSGRSVGFGGRRWASKRTEGH